MCVPAAEVPVAHYPSSNLVLYLLHNLAPCAATLCSTWIDTYGDYTLLNVTTGAKAYMYYQPCGWFGAGRYVVSGPSALAWGALL
jgi:hypothetical protein